MLITYEYTCVTSSVRVAVSTFVFATLSNIAQALQVEARVYEVATEGGTRSPTERSFITRRIRTEPRAEDVREQAGFKLSPAASVCLSGPQRVSG